MAAGTLLVLDASVPGGLIEGAGDVRYGQTKAFTTLVLFQIFNVLNARSDEDSAFVHLFTNQWLRAAMGGSVALQAFVVYVPFLQRAFGTTALSVGPGSCASRSPVRYCGSGKRAKPPRGHGAESGFDS
jgi:Ca2+-transporting ATPase